MLGAGFLRCFFLVGVMSWYTTSVWKTIDQYFRDQFKDYLQKEFESNEAIRRDIMLEAERIAAKKALMEKIGKRGFSKGTGQDDGIVDTLWRQDQFGHTTAEVTNEYQRNEYLYSKGLNQRGVSLGPEGNGDPGGAYILDEATERAKDGMASTTEEEWPNGESEEKYQQEDENFKSKYDVSEDECGLEECEESSEGKYGPQHWQRNFLDEDVCRLEDLEKKDSCGDP